MRYTVIIALFVVSAACAAANDLGNQAPVKAPATWAMAVPASGRQGGDTIATATDIPALPYVDTGSTIGYTDDYDEGCPYPTAMAPDVVYRYSSVGTVAVNIDLCGSDYDTKVYVYDADLYLIYCNDDFYFGPPCGMYVSKLENVTFAAGETYYIVVDGYGTASGSYILDVSEFAPCVLDCPSGGYVEGEPPLITNYVDHWNGGCNTPGNPFQNINGNNAGEAVLCGVTGWYLFYGDQYRDTDWFLLTMGQGGSIEITADAEFATYVFELGPQDCDAVGVTQQAIGGPCVEASMTISGYAPGAPAWFWVGPTDYYPPVGGDDEYDYVVRFEGLEAGVATEATTWGALKALYD